MHSKWTSLHPPSNAAKPLMCDNSQPFNYEWLQTVTSWQLPADEMSGNITLLYYRLLHRLIRASSIHVPGEWYYISPFYLNNINLLLQSPLLHCFLNKDIGFARPSRLLAPIRPTCWRIRGVYLWKWGGIISFSLKSNRSALWFITQCLDDRRLYPHLPQDWPVREQATVTLCIYVPYTDSLTSAWSALLLSRR